MNDGDYPLIQESGWRWQLSQLFFKLIYKRDYMWFSPWKNGGFAAGIVPFYHDKVLLAQRRGAHLAYVDKWCNPGGYLDLKNQESFIQAGIRETFEEVGIRIDSKQITDERMCHIALTYGKNMPEIRDYAHVVAYYWYELSDKEYAERQESDEAHNLSLYSEKEFETMVDANEMASEDTIQGIRAAFQAYKKEKNI